MRTAEEMIADKLNSPKRVVSENIGSSRPMVTLKACIELINDARKEALVECLKDKFLIAVGDFRKEFVKPETLLSLINELK